MGLLTILRHGQASFLSANYDRLSPAGEAQARAIGEYWKRSGVRFDRVIHGPAERHVRTGEIAREAYGDSWPEPETVVEFGEYAGLEVMRAFVPRVIEQDPELHALEERFRTAPDRSGAMRAYEKLFQRVTALWVAGELHSPEIENWARFCDRVDQGIAKACRHGGNVLVVSSGGPIAVAARHALELSPQRTLELSWMSRNASYSEFLYSGARFSLSCFNAHPHLAGEMLTYR